MPGRQRQPQFRVPGARRGKGLQYRRILTLSRRAGDPERPVAQPELGADRVTRYVRDREVVFDVPGHPHPRDGRPQSDEALGVGLGLPATRWMLEIGAFFMRSDTELLLKSRRVVPKRLLDAGFTFEHATWPSAATELASRAA